MAIAPATAVAEHWALVWAGLDVGTASTDGAFAVALTEAVLLELPLAVLAVGLALRLLRRPGRSR